MKGEKRALLSIIWVIIGVILIGLSFVGVTDSFWTGMGSGLAAVGVLQLLRYYRFNHNEAYREKIEIETKDERNLYIRDKAWTWSGYIFIIVTSVSVIVLKIIGQELLSMAASMAVCFMLVLYWVAYYILKRKY